MAETTALSVSNPLDSLTADELRTAVEVVRRERGLGPGVRFVSVTLHEPPKSAVYDFRRGDGMGREAELVMLDRERARTYEAVVSVSEGTVRAWRELQGVQPAIMVEEYEECERLVRAHPDFRAALQRRGITEADLHLVTVDPGPAGNFGRPEEEGKRLCRALAWMRPYPDGNSYARPLEGIVGLVDLHRGQVIRIEDNGAVPLPPGTGEYRAGHVGQPRVDLRPLEIDQPDGPSFVVDGAEVSWQRWSFRVGFTAREGLVLHMLAYDDGGRVRPVVYRASYSEMVVPYGDPSPNRYIQSPFDIGENLVGTLANSLERGCDCVGLIHYFDVVVSSSRGDPVCIPNAICLHEEDAGLLWKHWDFRNGQTEVRRSRRLVVSSISTIGNYEYGFFWYLYQDGTIESEVKLTGVLSTAAVPPGQVPPYGTLVAEGLNAMNHQHFFCVRLDVDVDGAANSVYEVHTEPVPPGPSNPYGNAFATKPTLLRREQEACAVIDPLAARTWLVANPSVTNGLGQPVGFRLVPGDNVRLFAQPDSAVARRAGFTRHHVWVTKYDPAERYPAGDYPNQHPGPAGLPEWTAANRSLENTDIVLWYTMGHHHIPRPEDWPVMPVATIGFKLQPFGFFERNPALDVPPPAGHDSCSRT